MVQINITLCDLCGEPYEVGGQMHGASMMFDIFVKNFSIYRESYNVCADCFLKTGLLKIVEKMKEKKEEHEVIRKKMSKKYIEKQFNKVLEFQENVDN